MDISIEHLYNKFKDKEEHYPLSDKFMEWCAENHKEQNHFKADDICTVHYHGKIQAGRMSDDGV